MLFRSWEIFNIKYLVLMFLCQSNKEVGCMFLIKKVIKIKLNFMKGKESRSDLQVAVTKSD